jgi:hypothetical protein
MAFQQLFNHERHIRKMNFLEKGAYINGMTDFI